MYNYYGNQQVITINGEPGARAYQMPANSSALLLDQTGPYVWLAQTDGAGYKDLKCYEIKPFVPEKAPDNNDLLARIEKLERMMNHESDTSADEKSE